MTVGLSVGGIVGTCVGNSVGMKLVGAFVVACWAAQAAHSMSTSESVTRKGIAVTDPASMSETSAVQ
jgi:hypothetical protein